MKHIFFILIFFLSILFLPWWVSIILAVIGVAYMGAYMTVFLGGVLLDTLFGTAVPTLFNSAYVYTTLFLLMIMATFAIRRFILE